MFTHRRDQQIPRQPLPQTQETPRKLAICTTGTYLQRMQEAIRFAETKRQRVTDLGKIIGDNAREELQRRHAQIRMAPPAQAQLDVVADTAIGNDARWRTAVGDEQWGYRLATMYALAELVAAERESNVIARDHLMAQEETNRLLRQLISPGNGSEVGFRGPAFDEPI